MADPPSPVRSPGTSSASNLRRRGFPSRAATFVEGSWPQRRNSTFSDSLSEARNSIRSSTDDIFLPRIARDSEDPVATEESLWHSAPLALALLPAIAGVFFQNGSVFVTDVTLLVLAAIFLNWSVRLPWDWYRSAQAIQRDGEFESPIEHSVEVEFDEADETEDSQEKPQRQKSPGASTEAHAVRELQIHELAALSSCFIFPVIGTWLLHGIRGSLSRPSEGLVSNYNLTIFLLASEVRPLAHLLKLVQARTLHLQRIVASSQTDSVDPAKVQDLTKRLEELEAHVAEAAAARLSPPKEQTQQSSPQETYDAPTLISQAAIEARQALRPDIEALNRAVRRYEKRTALTTLQADTRFQQLEAQVHDALSLAAVAQRSSAARRSSYAFLLVDWACACIVVPIQLALSILNFPGRVMGRCVQAASRMLGSRRPPPPSHSKSRKGKAVQGVNTKLGPQSPPPSRTAVSSFGQHQSSSSMWGSAR